MIHSKQARMGIEGVGRRVWVGGDSYDTLIIPQANLLSA